MYFEIARILIREKSHISISRYSRYRYSFILISVDSKKATKLLFLFKCNCLLF